MVVRSGFAQMKIQQMAFMILALLFFFTLVGLFFLNIAFKDIGKQADALERESTVAALRTIANMPELSCSSSEELCIDEDKLRVLSGEFGSEYESFWPVASIKVYKVYPVSQEKIIPCPAANCNLYEVYNNSQRNLVEYATFVSLCRLVKEQNYVHKHCDIGKLSLGVVGDE